MKPQRKRSERGCDGCRRTRTFERCLSCKMKEEGVPKRKRAAYLEMLRQIRGAPPKLAVRRAD